MTTENLTITYRIIATEDDSPVGSTWGPGEDEIIADCKRRLDNGDVWAWADVEVRAGVTINGKTYDGSAYICGCSYESEADWIASSGYYEGLKADAREDLIVELKAHVAQGKAVAAWLEAQPGHLQ